MVLDYLICFIKIISDFEYIQLQYMFFGYLYFLSYEMQIHAFCPSL
jgi:hypothetical protein